MTDQKIGIGRAGLLSGLTGTSVEQSHHLCYLLHLRVSCCDKSECLPWKRPINQSSPAGTTEQRQEKDKPGTHSLLVWLLARWPESVEKMSPLGGNSFLYCKSLTPSLLYVCLWQVWSLRGKVGRSHVLWLLRLSRRTSATSANMTTSTASMYTCFKINSGWFKMIPLPCNLWLAFLQSIHGD